MQEIKSSCCIDSTDISCRVLPEVVFDIMNFEKQQVAALKKMTSEIPVYPEKNATSFVKKQASSPKKTNRLDNLQQAQKTLEHTVGIEDEEKIAARKKVEARKKVSSKKSFKERKSAAGWMEMFECTQNKVVALVVVTVLVVAIVAGILLNQPKPVVIPPPSYSPTAVPTFEFELPTSAAMCNLARDLDIKLFDLVGWVCDPITRQPIIDYCSWKGITCIKNWVVKINLYISLNKGTIPKSIASFRNLTYLNLNANSLNGSIPSTIGYLYKLTYLNLGANHFTGVIPTSIAKISMLRYLDVSDNSLHGSIPTVIGAISGLSYGSFSNIQSLIGTIPSTFCRNILSHLDFSGTSITCYSDCLYKGQNTGFGTSSPCNFNVTARNIAMCDLANGLMTSTSKIGLKGWNCSSRIPQSDICHWTGVSCLGKVITDMNFNIDRNYIVGTLSTSLGLLNSLTVLQMSYITNLHGTIPTSIGMMFRLIRLSLYETSLSGSIPSTIGLLSNLNDLQLFSNPLLLGSIPSQLCNHSLNSLSIYSSGIQCYARCLSTLDATLVKVGTIVPC